MCRILVASFPQIPQRKIYSVLKTLSDGGNSDACGFAALKTSGELVWGKVPLPCSVVGRMAAMDKRLYKAMMEDTMYLIVHARKATVGDPLINSNNHPFCRDDMCLIHNGSVDMPERYTVEALEVLEAETDSAALLMALLEEDRRQNLVERAKRAWVGFHGKASVAVIDAKTMEMLYTKNYRADIHAWIADEKTAYLATAKDTLKALNAEQIWELKTATILWDSGAVVYAEPETLIEPYSASSIYSSYSYTVTRTKLK